MPAILEREIKLRFDSPDDARAAIRRLGATALRPRRLQADVVFDTPDRALMARGEVLRVRLEEGSHSLTFKSPAVHPTMKLREEIETRVGDGRMVMAILTKLGFEAAFRYEKFREEFSHGEVVVAIDETPVGTFVEIEGSDTGITAAATGLGRGPGDFVLESYRALFVQACLDDGVPPTDMLFPRADR